MHTLYAFLHGVYGVTVNTAGCGSANLGSIPSRHPRTKKDRISGLFFVRGCLRNETEVL